MTSEPQENLFNAYYFKYSCGRPYKRDDHWLTFFRAIAERIARDLHPESVLDAGCAMGFLVEGLRERQIEAYGIDISSYAIDQVHADIRNYCEVRSIAKELSRAYDLIVCIEVLEHMQPLDAEAAIRNLCGHANSILFSSTPLDYEEATHFNVRPMEYWAEQFSYYNFIRDVDYDASYINPWAVYYTKRDIGKHVIVRDFERRFWQLWKENYDLRKLNVEITSKLSKYSAVTQEEQAGWMQERINVLGKVEKLQVQLKETRARERVAREAARIVRSKNVQKAEIISKQRATLSELESKHKAVAEEAEELTGQLQAQDQQYRAIINSASWRVMEPVRRFRHKVFPNGSRRERLMQKFYRLFGFD